MGLRCAIQPTVVSPRFPCEALAPHFSPALAHSIKRWLLSVGLLVSLLQFSSPLRASTNLALPSPWDWNVNLKASLGYKDNVLLSSKFIDASPFFGSAIEAMVSRLPLDGTLFTAMLSAEDHRYWAAQDLDKEQWVIATAQVKRYGMGDWTWSVAGDYNYLDQIMDASITENILSTARMLGQGTKLRPALRRDFGGNNWAEIEGGANRQWLHSPFDSYWQGGMKLTVGHSYGHRSELTLSYDPAWRSYDTRYQLDARGAAMPGTHLNYLYHETQGQWVHYWDAKRRWRTATRLSLGINLDNGSGYFDFRRYLVAETLRYAAPSWQISAQAKLTYYDFPIQTAFPGSYDTRRKAIWLANLRFEKKLWKHLGLFAEYEHEASLSNSVLDEYRVNTVSAGIDWEW
jgi:hypothetical protein